MLRPQKYFGAFSTKSALIYLPKSWKRCRKHWYLSSKCNITQITIECFLRAQPLESMVFRWFSKFWGQWSTMVLRLTIVWMSHCKKCVKSIYDKTHILSRTCKWTSIESIWYGPYLLTPYITSQCEIRTIQQRKCLKCHKRHVKCNVIKQKSDLNEWFRDEVTI